MTKRIQSLLILGLLSSAAHAEFTDGPVNCSDLNGNEQMYGCIQDQDQATNNKYKCLEALNAFDVPKKEHQTADNFVIPGKLVKGKKIVATTKPDGKLALSDGKKNYLISQEKLKLAIQEKFSTEAAQKDKFKVVIQTPKGKIKLKIKKKPIEGGSGGFGLGGWEKVPMKENEQMEEDDVFMALGSQDENNNQDNMSEQLNDKVTNFEDKINDKLSEIENEAQEKKRKTRRNRALTSSDKRQHISKIEEQKEALKEKWRQKLAQKEQMKQVARVKCQGQNNLISGNVLGGSSSPAGGGEEGRLPASSQER
ncbi:MAG: hypothetical protein NXH75_14175 [Halobacteriovoraceae bacterium]|nr:hypothetical protein [Halobacteriovoraceae bacterium]